MPPERVADEVDLTERLRHLRELIAALGEVSGARGAAALREKALQQGSATLFARNTVELGRTEQPRTTWLVE